MSLKKNNWLILSCVSILLALLASSARAELGEGPGVPKSLTFCGETVPLNKPEVYESVDQELVLLVGARSRVWLTLRRSNRVLAVVHEALKANGVPDDVQYIPMALSNLTPNYYSSSGLGVWRLSKPTAAALGLTVNEALDERLDPYKSSLAAAKKLQQLKTTYGSWTLATAALVGNESEISKLVAETGLRDYYALPCSEATEKAMAWVLAAKALYQNPGHYGYHSGAGWLPFNRSQAATATTVTVLAAEWKISPKALKDANPHILGQNIPAGATLYRP